MIENRRRGRPRKNDKLVAVVVLMPQELAELLKKISRRYGRSRSSHLERVLRKYAMEENKDANT